MSTKNANSIVAAKMCTRTNNDIRLHLNKTNEWTKDQTRINFMLIILTFSCWRKRMRAKLPIRFNSIRILFCKPTTWNTFNVQIVGLNCQLIITVHCCIIIMNLLLSFSYWCCHCHCYCPHHRPSSVLVLESISFSFHWNIIDLPFKPQSSLVVACSS